MSSNLSFDFAGRTALVTGSTGGLGADIARCLHSFGANVVLTGRSAKIGDEIAQELGDRAKFIRADITNDDDIDSCLNVAKGSFGGLDFLVNNACNYADPGLDATREAWLDSLNINLVSAAILTAKAIPMLRESDSAVVVNLSSVAGKAGRAGALLYPAAKAAIHNVTKSNAVSLAPDGIRVLSVSPAWTWSPAIEQATGSIDRANAVGKRFHPIGRIGRGEEVAMAVAFACSDGASFMTGCDIPVDGGYTSIGPDQGRNPRLWLAEAAD